MAIEIERRFLVRSVPRSAGRAVRIEQAYFPLRGGTGRVRIAGDRAFLTVKGPPRGIARVEIEHPIPLDLARILMKSACHPGRVVKNRHRIRYAGRVWELDVFMGRNRGLVMAEVELPRTNAAIRIPPWAALEVTADRRFTNSSLARRPFRTWPAAERRDVREVVSDQNEKSTVSASTANSPATTR